MQQLFNERVIFNGPIDINTVLGYKIDTIPKLSTTPDVSNRRVFVLINTVAVTITNFLKGTDTQELVILGDGNTTLQHGTKIFTNTAANKLLAVNKVYRLTYLNSKWYEDA